MEGGIGKKHIVFVQRQIFCSLVFISLSEIQFNEIIHNYADANSKFGFGRPKSK